MCLTTLFYQCSIVNDINEPPMMKNKRKKKSGIKNEKPSSSKLVIINNLVQYWQIDSDFR